MTIGRDGQVLLLHRTSLGQLWATTWWPKSHADNVTDCGLLFFFFCKQKMILIEHIRHSRGHSDNVARNQVLAERSRMTSQSNTSHFCQEPLEWALHVIEIVTEKYRSDRAATPSLVSIWEDSFISKDKSLKLRNTHVPVTNSVRNR